MGEYEFSTAFASRRKPPCDAKAGVPTAWPHRPVLRWRRGIALGAHDSSTWPFLMHWTGTALEWGCDPLLQRPRQGVAKLRVRVRVRQRSARHRPGRGWPTARRVAQLPAPTRHGCRPDVSRMIDAGTSHRCVVPRHVLGGHETGCVHLSTRNASTHDILGRAALQFPIARCHDGGLRAVSNKCPYGTQASRCGPGRPVVYTTRPGPSRSSRLENARAPPPRPVVADSPKTTMGRATGSTRRSARARCPRDRLSCDTCRHRARRRRRPLHRPSGVHVPDEAVIGSPPPPPPSPPPSPYAAATAAAAAAAQAARLLRSVRVRRFATQTSSLVDMMYTHARSHSARVALTHPSAHTGVHAFSRIL